MKFLLRLLICALVIFLIAYWFPGLIVVDNFVTALIAALVLAVVNASIRPVVLVLTIPANVLTLGLFTFIVNALMLWLVSVIVPGFKIAGFIAALVASLLISVVSTFLSSLIIGRG
ncbi:MAG: phage holin family protein [Actinomycetota bacterium]|nr:phage holin family protein [Actinomycetota bacterium]